MVTPVLQHLMHAVAGGTGTFDDNGLLQGLIEGEYRVEALIDGGVFSVSYAPKAGTCHIVATDEGVLDTLAEEIEGVLQ